MLKIGVVGLGYVGLPLFKALRDSRWEVDGFDINEKLITQLSEGVDRTGELGKGFEFGESISADPLDLKNCNVYIVCVPTPVDHSTHEPDLMHLSRACETVGQLLQHGDLVIFESTVYPGLTEGFCLPILEQFSKLRHQESFSIGYSPERINPGDSAHSLKNTVKIISADGEKSLETMRAIYGSICEAGLYEAPSIAVAEAAKVFENVQRDVNIALVNELSSICQALKIETRDVLDAATTKWNFIRFDPGLVGGHCVSVDPYYLACCASKNGVKASMILAGRAVNDGVVDRIHGSLVSLRGQQIEERAFRTLILGLTFKENVPDFRNSLAIRLGEKLLDSGFDVVGWDPHYSSVNQSTIPFAVLSEVPNLLDFDAVVIAVIHQECLSAIKEQLTEPAELGDCAIYDLHSILPVSYSHYRL